MKAERRGNLTIVGDHDEKTIEQMQNCLKVEGSIGALMPDGHLGYSQPVGGVAAYPEHVSVSGVGYDIGCGNKLVVTDIMLDEFLDDADDSGWHDPVSDWMDEIFDRVSFGMGRKNNEQVDHPVLDEIRDGMRDIKGGAHPQQEAMLETAAKQLGTVGSGNHYVDLFYDELGRVCVGVHFGSRGFGHKTATGFLNLTAGRAWDQGPAKGSGGEKIMGPPVLLHQDSGLGQAYIGAMNLAGAYAHAGRDVVCAKVLEILGVNEIESVHNHHNYAWRESHGGRDYWVVRKGATPAFPGQRGFVGATMGEESVVLEGTIAPDYDRHIVSADVVEELSVRQKIDAFQSWTLNSTVHGAGRVMSRTKAAGKIKRRKQFACMDRDCDKVFKVESAVCHDHPDARVKKVWTEEVKEAGLIDWKAARADLREKGIVLRGAAADEAPLAYKRLPEVLDACGDTITVLHTLTPIGVAMAGPDVRDDFRD